MSDSPNERHREFTANVRAFLRNDVSAPVRQRAAIARELIDARVRQASLELVSENID